MFYRATSLGQNNSSRLVRGLFVAFAVLTALLVLRPLPTYAAVRTASVTGNWNNTATWGGNPVPVDGDSVVVNTGVVVTVNVNTAAVTTVTLNAAATHNGITISGSNVLNATGAITLNQPSAGTVTSTLDVGAGKLNAASIAIPGSATAGRSAIVTVSTGTINVTGGITFSGAAAQAQLTFTGAGTLNIGGNLGSGGTFTKATGVVNFNGTSAQTFAGYNYNTIRVNNTAGVTPSAAPTITTLTIADSTSSSVFSDGAFTITTATTLNLNDGTYNCTAATFPWGTLNAGTGTVAYNLSGIQTVAGRVYYNLTLGGTSAKTFAVSSTIMGTESMEGTATVTYTTDPTMGPASTLKYAKTAPFTAGDEWQATLAGNVLIANSGGAITASTAGTSFVINGTLTINSGASLTMSRPMSVAGATDVTGTLTFGSGTVRAYTFTGDVTLNAGSTWTATAAAHTYTIVGNFTNNSTSFTASTGIHTFSGSGKTISGSTVNAIPSVTVSGTIQNDGTLTVATALAGSGTLTNGATGTLNYGGAGAIVPTLTATAVGNTVNYNRSGTQTVKATTYDNLTLSGTSAKTMTSVSTINANFTLSGTAAATAATALTIGGNVTLGSSTTFTGGAFTHNLGGDWTNNGGTFTSTGTTLNFNKAGAQAIGGSGALLFNNVTLATSGIKTFSAVATIGGTLTISGSAQAALASGTNSLVNALNLGGVDRVAGTWGSSSSIASNSEDTYFSASTGYVTVATGPTAGTWTGTISTDWNVGGNWFGGSVPSATTDVFIPSAPSNQPIIGVAGGLAKSVTINSGATLTITGSNTLTVSGNWQNNGTFTANTSVVTFDATSSIDGSGTGNFYDVVLNGSFTATLAGAETISHNLTIGSGTTLANGGFALAVTGTLTLNSGATLNTTGSGTLTVGTFTLDGTYNYGSTGTQTVTNLAVGATGVYNHASTAVALLRGSSSSTWNAASNLNVTGSFASATNITNFMGETFGNFFYNATGQTNTVSLVNANGTTTIQGNFSVSSTGSSTLYMRISGQIFAGVIVVNGDFNISGGTFDLHNGGPTANTQQIDLYGNFNMTGGTITQTTATAGSRAVFNFHKSGTQTFTKSGGTISSGTTVGPGIQFIVLSGSTLDLGTSILTGTNQTTFTLSSGAGLITANTAGITSSGATGAIQVANTRTYSTGADYTYNGTANQAAGNGLPATVNSLTINNSGGSGDNTVTLSQAETVTGNLNVTSGVLSLSTFTHSANALYLNGVLQPSGSWGSSSSPALHQNDTYFSPTTGIVNAATGATTYAITYDGNGNTGGAAPVDGSSPYILSATVTVLGPGSLTKTGYSFGHWNTASDDSATSYDPADTFGAAGDVTLYAQWGQTDFTAPVIVITAPMKVSSSTITNTTFQVTDETEIASSTISIAASTAGTANLVCTQTSSTQVDCTVDITSSGNLVVDATDLLGNPAIQTSETGYVIETTVPVIVITAPTKISNATISNTTIQVTDDTAIASSTVSVDASTAGVSNLVCTQTSGTQVDCTVDITSNGDLVVDATDVAGNPAIQTSETGYVFETTAPVIVITAPTKTSSSTISDTTIQITDDTAISSSTVSVGASTAGVSNLVCTQTSGTQVDCTVDITSSGNLIVDADDVAGNPAIQVSETGYVINSTVPVISITAPTKTSNATITNTTIQVTDDLGISSSTVSVGASTAGTSNLVCTQTSATQVDCTVNITSSGNLIVDATDDALNPAVQTSETGYVIETTIPVIVITAPTKTNSAPITDTTIQVTDNNAISTSGVSIGSSTAGTSGFSCTQTSATQVDCTVNITSSGDLTVDATDVAGNAATPVSETAYTILAASAETPVITPDGGIFPTPQTVTITSASSVTIHYTTDGSPATCTGGTTYTGSFVVSSSATVKAVGCDLFNNPSPQMTSVINIGSTGGGGGGGGGGLSTGGGGGGTGSIAPIVTTYQSVSYGLTQQQLLNNLSSNGVPVHGLVKLPDDGNPNTQIDTTVYYVGTDGMRHVFPNPKVFFTWYQNFDGVQIVGEQVLASIPLGKNITYKPGKKMVKFLTDPKVYVVSKGGILHWVNSEAAAKEMYGANWAQNIDDINDTFYVNYTFGALVTGLVDFNPATVEASVTYPSDSLELQ